MATCRPGAFYRNNVGFMLVLVALTAWASATRATGAASALFFWVSGQQLWNALFHVYTEHQLLDCTVIACSEAYQTCVGAAE